MADTEKLSEEEAQQKAEELNIWNLTAGKLATRVEFENYKEAVFFANTVFSLAESHFHHPEVKVEYGAVEIDLWSHEADGLTEEDFQLAERIEQELGEMKWS